MPSVSVTKSINIPATQAWAELSTFSGIENYSPIERSVTTGQGAGATRICYMPDGAQIDEVLNSVDHNEMHFQYAITSGPFPVSDYVSDVRIKSLDVESCEITWSCTYNASSEHIESMNGLFEGFYNMIIESLEGYVKETV